MIHEMNKQPRRLTCLISLMAEHRVRSSQKSGFDFWSSLNVFSFFFNRLGCLLNCEGHFHFHIFIHRSKYESFHTFPFKKTSGGKKKPHYEGLSGVTWLQAVQLELHISLLGASPQVSFALTRPTQGIRQRWKIWSKKKGERGNPSSHSRPCWPLRRSEGRSNEGF